MRYCYKQHIWVRRGGLQEPEEMDAILLIFLDATLLNTDWGGNGVLCTIFSSSLVSIIWFAKICDKSSMSTTIYSYECVE
jgi:hypothetical protein